MLIILFGPDGSGKTTLTKKLAEKLYNDGFNVRITWMRGSHTLVSLLGIILSKFDSFKGSDNPYYGITIPQKLRRLWQNLEFLSLLPVLLIRFLLPNILGYVVIAERYLPDFIIWVSITTRDPSYPKSLTARFLKALAIKAKARIYVTADLATLLKRREDMDPIFLEKQLKLYENLASSMDVFRLDTTNKSIRESADMVIEFLQLIL